MGGLNRFEWVDMLRFRQSSGWIDILQKPYMTKETHEELVELLPHKWKALHPEAIMTKLRDEV